MKFAGILVLALGASAYVVNDAPERNAVEARNPVRDSIRILRLHNVANIKQSSGSVRASHAVNVVARHRGYPLFSNPLQLH